MRRNCASMDSQWWYIWEYSMHRRPWILVKRKCAAPWTVPPPNNPTSSPRFSSSSLCVRVRCRPIGQHQGSPHNLGWEIPKNSEVQDFSSGLFHYTSARRPPCWKCVGHKKIVWESSVICVVWSWHEVQSAQPGSCELFKHIRRLMTQHRGHFLQLGGICFVDWNKKTCRSFLYRCHTQVSGPNLLGTFLLLLAVGHCCIWAAWGQKSLRCVWLLPGGCSCYATDSGPALLCM